MKKLITVITVPHTGTRSLMNVVDKDGYKKLAEFLRNTKKIRKLQNRKEIFHSNYQDRRHIYLPEFILYWERSNKSNNIEEYKILKEDSSNIIHGHIDNNSIDAIKFLSNHTKIITTCRDPLLSLISAKQKNNTQIQADVVNSGTYSRLKKLFESWQLWKEFIYPNSFIVPVDIKKENLIYDNFDFSVIHNVRITYNKKGYPLKMAYEDGDLAFIKKELGKDYDTLVDMKPLLKPILEEIGYRDLLWW